MTNLTLFIFAPLAFLLSLMTLVIANKVPLGVNFPADKVKLKVY